MSTLHLYAIDAATAELALDPHFSLRLTGAARKTVRTATQPSTAWINSKNCPFGKVTCQSRIAAATVAL